MKRTMLALPGKIPRGWRHCTCTGFAVAKAAVPATAAPTPAPTPALDPEPEDDEAVDTEDVEDPTEIEVQE